MIGRNTENSSKIYGILMWVLCGILIILATYFTYANDFKCVSFSIKNNYIYEVDAREIPEYTTIDGNGTSIVFTLYLDDGPVHYLRVKGTGIGKKQLSVCFFGMDSERNIVYSTEEMPMHDGNNDIPITSQDYVLGKVKVIGTENNVIKDVEFRESVAEHPISGAIKYIVITFFGYILITLLVLNKGARLIEHVQAFHITTKNYSFLKTDSQSEIDSRGSFSFAIPLSGKIAGYVRSFLWFLLIVNTLMSEEDYKENFTAFFIREVLVVLVLAIMLFDRDHPSFSIHIDKSMFAIWAMYAIYTLFSDILVEKIPRFSGVITFLVIALMGYVWAMKRDDESFLSEFEIAVEVFFIYLVLLSIITNRELSTERYSGPMENPSIYALYLSSTWAIIMASLESQIRLNKYSVKTIINIIEAGIAIILMILSQSITPFIAVVAISVMWAYRVIRHKKGSRYAIRVLCVLLLAVICASCYFINTMPSVGSEGSRITQKIATGDISTILSGRDYYYRCYLRKMNIFGHGSKPILWGKGRLPHNLFIGEAYVYGVPVLVSFIMLLIKSVEKAVKLAKRPIKGATIPLYGIVSFIIMSLADNTDRYFIWLPWISCYMMFAPILFVNQSEEMNDKNED